MRNDSGGIGTLAAVGLGLVVLYLLVKGLPSIQIPQGAAS